MDGFPAFEKNMSPSDYASAVRILFDMADSDGDGLINSDEFFHIIKTGYTFYFQSDAPELENEDKQL